MNKPVSVDLLALSTQQHEYFVPAVFVSEKAPKVPLVSGPFCGGVIPLPPVPEPPVFIVKPLSYKSCQEIVNKPLDESLVFFQVSSWRVYPRHNALLHSGTEQGDRWVTFSLSRVQ